MCCSRCRAAESIIFNKISTGALSDLEKVTKQAMAMVTISVIWTKKLVMFPIMILKIKDMDLQNLILRKLQRLLIKIKKIIDGQYERAKAILKKHEDKLHQLANKLLETEVIFKEDLEVIFAKDLLKKK